MRRLIESIGQILSCETRRDKAQLVLAFIGVMIALLAVIIQAMA